MTGELVADGGTVLVADVDGSAGGPIGSPSPWEVPDDGWLTLVPNGARLTGFGHRHSVRIRLQHWAAAPPLPTPSEPQANPVWDRSATGQLFLSSGHLELVEIFGEVGAALPLGAAATWWQLRAHARTNPLPDWIDPATDQPPHDECLLQLWQATPP
ncbi:hypothetical protein [Actinomadura kijaniata]|uniref:hypothetical protein n=1 Tax=Actinomadura kijaniata TaxID=46161 RepID=UPI000833C0D3|nr:hypothetical protein [Actinomadura kijaniata]